MDPHPGGRHGQRLILDPLPAAPFVANIPWARGRGCSSSARWAAAGPGEGSAGVAR